MTENAATGAMAEFLKKGSSPDTSESDVESTVRNLYGDRSAAAAASSSRAAEPVHEPAPASKTDRGAPDEPIPLVAEDPLPVAAASSAASAMAKRPSKRILAGAALVIAAVVALTFGSGSEETRPAAETPVPTTVVPPAALPEWNSVRSDNDLLPLSEGATDAPLATAPAATSTALENQILSGQVPPAAAAGTPLQPPAPGGSQLVELSRSIEAVTTQLAEQGGNIQTIIARLDALEADIQKLKTARQPAKRNGPVKAPQAPTPPAIRVSAITRTPDCGLCQPFAIIDAKGKLQQVGNGDTVLGYRVSITDDRVVLSSGKTQFSYFPNSR